MISLPSKGIAPSRTKHNVNPDFICDWFEASCLFLGKEISGSDFVDILIENNIYSDQDFAWVFVNDIFSRIEIRARLLGDGYPLEETVDGYKHRGDWEDFSPYAFCLMLSLANSHSPWIAGTFPPDYTTQGELFEDLTAEAVAITLTGWSVRATGWTKTRTVRIKQVVEEICGYLNETAGEIFRWTKETAKEAGLDLVTWRPFADGNVGVPIYLWQCASGTDWKEKRKTPDIALWSRIITFAVQPRRAMAMPFALSDADMRQSSVVVEGLLLDRHRLLEPGINKKDWISNELQGRIIDWMWPRVAQLPLLSDGV